MSDTAVTLADVLAAVERRAAPLLLTGPQAAAYLGVGLTTFERLTAAGELARPVSLPEGGKRWRRADLDRFVGRLKPARRTRREVA